MATETKRLWTFEEYAERPDELAFAELKDGELIMAPAPQERHQYLALEIATSLRVFLRDHPVGRVHIAPFDVRLDPAEDKAYHPDVLFVSRDRAGIISSKGIQGAPDLVVEVLSPDTIRYDLGDKKRAYQDGGVQEYWAVWQDLPRIEVYRLNASSRYGDPHLLEAGEALTTDLLPGFAQALDDLYRDLPAEEA